MNAITRIDSLTDKNCFEIAANRVKDSDRLTDKWFDTGEGRGSD